MIKIVARPTHGSECDLLAGNERETLVVRDLAGRHWLSIEPLPEWSHDTLESIASRADVVEFVVKHFGADAFLGGRWVGSSEV